MDQAGKVEDWIAHAGTFPVDEPEPRAVKQHIARVEIVMTGCQREMWPQRQLDGLELGQLLGEQIWQDHAARRQALTSLVDHRKHIREDRKRWPLMQPA